MPPALATLALILGLGAAVDARAAVLTLEVDARDTAHRLFTVHETIPARPGRMRLLYPQWDPASHAPTGSAASLAGLTIRSKGTTLPWRRDPKDPFAFTVVAPAGADRLEIDFQTLTAFSVRQGAVRMTPNIIDLQWPELLLYPAGAPIRAMMVEAALRLPAGFTAATALEALPTSDGLVRYRRTSVEALADSPVLAGRHLARHVLGSFRGAPVEIDVAGDDAADTDIPPTRIAALQAMLQQTERLLPGRPFVRYNFLVALSDALPGPGGIEHRQSSDNVLPPGFFTSGPGALEDRDLLAHEYAHAWNGLFRRPRGLVADDLNTPVSGELLWVYEGQTEFWGRVLAARSGLRTFAETLDALAGDAAVAASRAGRRWKSLQDSTNDPLMMSGRPVIWRDWQRREDYYVEGVLLWLAVDMRLREMTAGRRSLDDFAARFFAAREGDSSTAPYGFDDVAAALEGVAPGGKWAAFLRERLDTHQDAGLLDGLERSGYRLVFTATPGPAFLEQQGADLDLSYGLGLVVDSAGRVRTVAWDSPAFRAGLAPNARLLTVNGRPFTIDALRGAPGDAPLRLAFEADGVRTEAEVPATGPLRFPHLQRIPGVPDRLADLLKAR